MGAEIYQNLKSVVKKKYGIDGIFYKLLTVIQFHHFFGEKGLQYMCRRHIFCYFFYFYEEYYDQMCWLRA